MEDSVECYESLLRQGANRLTGHARRLFQAEVTLKLCAGNVRKAERRFGWGRATLDKGLHELQQGVRCLENFSARGRPRLEEKTPQLAEDIRALVEPHTQADPELKSARRYSSLSAAEVLEFAVTGGRVLASMVRTSRAHVRAYHPAGMADPEGFAGMGCHEALLHGNDIAQAFGLSLDPPRDVCRRVLARIFPQAPTDLAESDPWTALQWAGGRIELPGHPQQPSWRPHPAPLTS